MQAVLVAMAREAMSNKWDLQRVLDQKTLSVAYEAYRRSVVKDQDPILTDFLSVLQAAMENIDNESGTLGQKIVGLGKESKDKSAEEHQDLDRNTQASPSAKKVYVPKRYPAKKNRERSRPVSKVTSSSI